MGNGELNHAQIEIVPHALISTQKEKTHSSQKDDESTTDADPGRVGRVEQDEARPGNSAPRSGTQLE